VLTTSGGVMGVVLTCRSFAEEEHRSAHCEQSAVRARPSPSGLGGSRAGTVRQRGSVQTRDCVEAYAWPLTSPEEC